jgi:hypothetical protein
METPLKFEELSIGMEVEDWWGEPGKVTECDDPHNVLIEFNNGGSSLYCMVDDCENRDLTPIYKLIKE